MAEAARVNGLYYETITDVQRNKKTVSIMVVGKRGTGKSTLCTRIALDLDWRAQQFSVEEFITKRVCKSLEQLLEVVATLKMGDAVILEEAGIQAGHRDWQSEDNNALAKVLQLIRFKRIILIFNVPKMDLVDKVVKEMFDIQVETFPGIDRIRGINRCTVTRYVATLYTKYKMRPKYIRKRIDGHTYKTKIIEFRRPPIKYEVEYKKQSEAFKNEYIKKTVENLRNRRKIDEKKETVELPLHERVTDHDVQKIAENLGFYMSNNKKGLSAAKIADYYGVGESVVRVAKARIERLLNEKGLL